MRRYAIISVISLFLSIIDFALAAPVLVQEKRQACVDVVHIPEDVITILGKRGYGELEKLGEYFKPWGESSDSHASSSSARPEPDHGSTNVVQQPALAPNPASSPANPNPLMVAPNPSATESMPSWDYFNAMWDDRWSYKPGAHVPPSPNPSPRPLRDPNFDWDHWYLVVNLPQPKPASWKEFIQAHEYQMERLQQPSSGHSSARPSFEPDSDHNLIAAYQPEHEVVTPPSPNLGSQNDVVHGPPPGPESTDSELHLDHQMSISDPQSEDPQAAISAAKGKAKQLRRISGTARDVGNAVPRELQPAERSLDMGDGEFAIFK